MGDLVRKFLTEDVLYRKEWLDRFLDPDQENIAQFDSQLGYTLRTCQVKDAMDGAYSIAHYEPTGERRMVNFADRPCRINTYGNSFTQCAQVSDGESWQEMLAAHIGEPIRNYGIGGDGVYHAYLRMKREEATPRAAEYVILNIYDDDHVRNIDAWRHFRTLPWFEGLRRGDPETAKKFHANPWAYLRMDLNTGEWIECESLCPTPESLYKMCDPEYVYELLKDDPVVHLYLARQQGRCERTDILRDLAEALGIEADLSSPPAIQASATAIHEACGFRSAEWVVDRTIALAREAGKKLMIALSYGGGWRLTDPLVGKPRWDQTFVDFLKGVEVPVLDSYQAHAEDFKAFRLSPEDYAKRYYIGHYNPKGNQFFAFAIKDALVAWLDPKPPAYRDA